MAQPAKETTRRTSPDRARKTAVLIFIMVSVLFSLSLFICNYVVSRHYRSLESASRSFASAQKAAADLQTGSDYLTEKVRSFFLCALHHSSKSAESRYKASYSLWNG